MALDRYNLGFAKLQMVKDLGFSEAVYGFGAGIVYLVYMLFEIPSNLFLERIGARKTFARRVMEMRNAGMSEEQPEMSSGRHWVGHDGNRQAGMPAGLESERRPQVVQAILEFTALLGDRAPRQGAEPARDEPHPDPRRVEVDGRDQPIGSHGGMIAQAAWPRSGRRDLTPTRPRSGGSGRPRGDACDSAC